MEYADKSIKPLALVLLLTMACASPPPASEASTSSTYDRELELRDFGFRRSYRVHVPASLDGDARRPLIVAIHGAFSSPDSFARETGLDRLADDAGFVVAYPAAFAPPIRIWNSGHCCGLVRTLGIDDIGVIEAVIEDARAHLPIDPSRIYVVGHSNGGMLIHRLAAERPGLVAAAAVVAGTIGGRPSSDEPTWRIPVPKRALPLLLVHGQLDDQVAYDGGPDPRSLNGRTWISARESAQFWSQNTRCAPDSQRQTIYAGGVTREVWSGPSGCSVELQSLHGWGHAWPSREATREALAPDHPLHGFDLAETVWSFFNESTEAQVAASPPPPSLMR